MISYALSLDGAPGSEQRRSVAPVLEGLTLLAFIAAAVGSYFILTGSAFRTTLLTPAAVALLLVANLVPAMGLLVLVGRRIARQRAARSVIGGDARLHVRLVAIFSLIAAVPTLLVAIFASILFQTGVDFWFSDRSRGMFENAASLAQGYAAEKQQWVAGNAVAMAQDMRRNMNRYPIDSAEFKAYYIQQVIARQTNRSAIIVVGEDGIARTPTAIQPDASPVETRFTPKMLERFDAGEEVIFGISGNRVEAVAPIDARSHVYLYLASDAWVPGVVGQIDRAKSVLADYNNLFARSKQLQLGFNIALYVMSLLLVGLAVWVALIVADRLVKPVVELVSVTHDVAEGDLTARVTDPGTDDEFGLLARAFNRMTAQLEGQTAALVQANGQLEARRAFIEAVLAGVTAGILSLDGTRTVRLANPSAMSLLRRERADLIGQPLSTVAPELAAFVEDSADATALQMSIGGELRTFAVKRTRDNLGDVLTFEDITQQLLDQRRAAWSDVARRIAHEIKNPLTPIQLAAERLQRRYGKQVEADRETFDRLTSTIVRQVGDLRRMVDEFSSFARMPKPIFREENIVDLARQMLFLQEVAHPGIRFQVDVESAIEPLVCDRRQMGQLFTNIFKNAVEAVEQKDESGDIEGEITLRISSDDQFVTLVVSDSGIGLPEDRMSITEPYMTTREGGTGLGLAIVKKIVEEHFGEIGFADREGGGTIVTLRFNREMLQPLAAGGDEESEEEVAAPPKRDRIKVNDNGA